MKLTFISSVKSKQDIKGRDFLATNKIISAQEYLESNDMNLLVFISNICVDEYMRINLKFKYIY